MKLLRQYGITNAHALLFLGSLLACWLVYTAFIQTHFHYSIRFLFIFLMGFGTFWGIEKLRHKYHADGGARAT
jgi:hypothetical protein